jgi:hypothetical protein
MVDLKCSWGICRDDVYEFVTEEFCTLPQLLEELTELIKAWDDPEEESPGFLLCRSTPAQRADREKLMARLAKRGALTESANG